MFSRCIEGHFNKLGLLFCVLRCMTWCVMIQKLRAFDLRTLWIRGGRDQGAIGNRRKSVDCKASNYFLMMSRWEVFRWHLGGFLSFFGCQSNYYQLIHHRYVLGFPLIRVQNSEVR